MCTSLMPHKLLTWMSTQVSWDMCCLIDRRRNIKDIKMKLWRSWSIQKVMSAFRIKEI